MKKYTNDRKRVDELRHMLYRLDQLKNPDLRIRNQLLEEIEKCDRSNAHPSTNNAPRKSSTNERASPKQQTLQCAADTDSEPRLELPNGIWL